MNRTLRMLVALAIAALALTSFATPGQAAMRWGAEAWGAWNSHSMKDWNKVIDDANSFGANYDNITSGYSFGVGPSVVLGDNFRLGAHFESLMAKKSEDAGTTVEPKATAFGASLDYLVPSSGMFQFSIGGAVDMMKLSGTVSDPSTSEDINGDGIGFQVRGMAAYAFSPMFLGELGVGYRMADIDIDDIGGTSTAGSGLNTEDYSGVTIRLGIRIQQPK